MSDVQLKTGFINVGNAKLYYEMAGAGTPFLMIHAGVADNRQWNNEFEYFSRHNKVIRYDMRGYGKSEPVDGEFSHMSDLVSLLDSLEINEPIILMGCSMGGGLAMDFALAHPSKVKALIMVGSAPTGLELDIPANPKFAEVEKAFNDGDMDLVSELETQIWFDGTRASDQVDQKMRKLLFDMNLIALKNEVKELGKRLPNTESPAFDRLGELKMPVLIVVGVHDSDYIRAAGDFMAEKIKTAKKVMVEDAAHLPNMDHPDVFQGIVKEFLQDM